MRLGLAWVTLAGAGIVIAIGAGLVVAACTIVNDEHVVQAPTTYPTLLPLAKGASACRWVEECAQLGPSMVDSLLVPLPPASIENFAACVDILSGPFANPLLPGGSRDKTLQCIAAATSCDDALACVPFENVPTGDSRCSGAAGAADAGPSCLDSQSLLSCTNDPENGDFPTVQHCGSAAYETGSKCDVLFGGCTVKEACSPAGTSCKGNLISSCANDEDPDASTGTVVSTFDCAVEGQTCGMTTFGPTCVNSAENSGGSLSDGQSCLGPVILLSAANNEIGIPCSNIAGSTCSEDPTARCVVANAKCSPYDGNTVNICTGNTISLCVAGEITSFDCSSIGTSCAGDQEHKHANCQ